jgi:hypothetical protein
VQYGSVPVKKVDASAHIGDSGAVLELPAGLAADDP